MGVEQTIVKELIVKQLKWRVTPKTVIRLGARKKKKKGMPRKIEGNAVLLKNVVLRYLKQHAVCSSGWIFPSLPLLLLKVSNNIPSVLPLLQVKNICY